jgi:Spy/CpxP family protein refolding chaperone
MTSCRTFASSLLLASSLGTLAAPAVAAPQDCGPAGMRGAWAYRGERMAQHHQRLHDALKLTPEQEGAWKKLMDSQHPMAGMQPGKPTTGQSSRPRNGGQDGGTYARATVADV